MGCLDGGKLSPDSPPDSQSFLDGGTVRRTVYLRLNKTKGFRCYGLQNADWTNFHVTNIESSIFFDSIDSNSPIIKPI
jgi:hypothetical protein